MSTRPKRRKGIYILPNLFTITSLFLGFYAIIAATNSHFVAASIAVLLAMVFDSLDGRVARLINAQSAFGAELDSLSDMVSFAVAPAMIVYNLNIEFLKVHHWDKLGWLSTFLYMACVALRLARFNIHTDDEPTPESKRYFIGLPCPAAAGFIVSAVWVIQLYHLMNFSTAVIMSLLMVILAWLEVSNIRYRSFKDVDLKVNVRFTVIVLLVLAFIFVSWQPAQMLFAIFFVYLLSGLYGAICRWLMKPGKVSKQEKDTDKRD